MNQTPDQVIVEDNFKQFKLANYPTLSDDDAFERFVMSILLKRYEITPADIERGLVSGTDDGGIDGFYLVLNGRELVETDSIRVSRRKNRIRGLAPGLTLDVVIVQSKKERRWDSNVFLKIESSLKFIMDSKQSVPALQEFPFNADVIEKIITLRKLRSNVSTLLPIVTFYVYYASLADQDNIQPQMLTKSKQVRTWLRENLPTDSQTVVEYVGDAELVTRLRASTDFQSKLVLKKPPIRDGNSLVGLVLIKNYLKFLRHDSRSKAVREEMFAVNVRDYAGSNIRVNDAIVKTLSFDSESLFWWLNNGITIISDAAKDPLELEWVLTNPLIVNGLQTSHVLHEQDLAGSITRKRLNQAVLVRVITESDPRIRESIIAGTNNQTAITSLQLHANEEKQVRIEEYLKASGWYYERRRHQYRGQAIPAGRIRNATQVGQAVIAYKMLQPDTARARPTTLLGNKAGWNDVFDPGNPEELYLKALTVLEKVDEYLRTPAAKKVADDSTNARFYLSAGYALQSSGVKTLVDFSLLPVHQLKKAPTRASLAELHALLYRAYSALDKGTNARDIIFKGAQLKTRYFEEILKRK